MCSPTVAGVFWSVSALIEPEDLTGDVAGEPATTDAGCLPGGDSQLPPLKRDTRSVERLHIGECLQMQQRLLVAGIDCLECACDRRKRRASCGAGCKPAVVVAGDDDRWTVLSPGERAERVVRGRARVSSTSTTSRAGSRRKRRSSIRRSASSLTIVASGTEPPIQIPSKVPRGPR